MDKDTLEKMATQAFANLNTTRAALFAAAEKVISIEMELDSEKDAAMLSGKITGSNDILRKSQLKDATQKKGAELATAQSAERLARFGFDRAGYDVDTVKTLLRIAELPA